MTLWCLHESNNCNTKNRCNPKEKKSKEYREEQSLKNIIKVNCSNGLKWKRYNGRKKTSLKNGLRPIKNNGLLRSKGKNSIRWKF